MNAEEVVREACNYYIDAELYDGFFGKDIRIEEGSAVLLFSNDPKKELLGVRFPLPSLPQEGLAYRGVNMRTPKDWIHDLSIMLMEELGTGLAQSGDRIPRPGWTELVIPAGRRLVERSDYVGEWADP